MRVDQLNPTIVVLGAIVPEPVHAMVVVPRGKSVKLIGKGLTSGKDHEPSLNAAVACQSGIYLRDGAIQWGPTHGEAGNRRAAVHYRDLPDDGGDERNDEGRAALQTNLEPVVLSLAQGGTPAGGRNVGGAGPTSRAFLSSIGQFLTRP